MGLCACICTSLTGCGGSTAATAPSEKPAARDEPGPQLTVPEGPPPKRLVVKDLKVGNGRVARKGDDVTIQYVGLHWDGEVYSNSRTFSGPPTLTIGNRELDFGLDRGIRGMREGGRREILVPRSRIYYPDVKKHAPIPPGDGLVFLVDLLAVHPR